MNKRDFTRVELSEWASVKYEEQIFFGDVGNVSLQGLFIKTEHEIPLYAPVEVTVYHSPATSIHLSASVVRREEHGFGMQIRELDVNSFVHLRNVVAKKCHDHELIMRETYKMANCIH